MGSLGVCSSEITLPSLQGSAPQVSPKGTFSGSRSDQDSKATATADAPISSKAFDASIGATRVASDSFMDEAAASLDSTAGGSKAPRPAVELIVGGQWKYYMFFVIKALLISGTIAMVIVNCALGPPDETRQRTNSQAISVAGQTCQINPLIDSWWTTLVAMGALQFLWAAGAAVYYAFTGWFPRNSSEVYLLQLPVSTISLVSAGAGLAGGGYLLLMLSWFVVSLMSGFAVVAGLLTGVPGLFDKLADPAAATAGGVQQGSLVSKRSNESDGSSSRRVQPVSAVQMEESGEFAGENPNPRRSAPLSGAEIGDSLHTSTAGARSARIASAQADANDDGEVDNPYSVTVQQYGRWYTALLLLYEFNKISDIATALILGVGDPLRVAFFVLGTLSLVHVQVTFYWLVGTRDGDTTVIDLYRGFGDVVLDTPMLCIEFYAIVTGVITEANFTVFVISLVLKSLSTLSHIFTLYKDIKLFLESRSRENFRHIGSRLKNSLAKSSQGMKQMARTASQQFERSASFEGQSGSWKTDRATGNTRGGGSMSVYKNQKATAGPIRRAGVQGNRGAKPALLAEPVALSTRKPAIVRSPV